MNELISFRAFQGLGAAGLMPIAMAVVGDLFTPRERGKWQGVTGSVFGLSSIIGPLVGGSITENLSWRWVFYVNLPIGILAMIVLIFLMPALGSRSQKVSIDYIGSALLIIGTVPLLLGFTWAGSSYAWLSPQIIGLFVVAIVALVTFMIYEQTLLRRGAEPVINPTLFKNRTFATSVLITMLISMGLFGSIYFLPLFAQGVMGTSATASGLLLTPMMLSLVVSSVISGQLVSRFGKYKWMANVGMGITVVGSLLLLRLNINSVPLDLVVAMIVFGLGLGFGMSLYTLMVQNALPRQIGEATAALSFFRSIGGTVALAAMGSLMTAAYVPAFHNALPDTVKRIVPNSILYALDNPNILLSPNTQQQLMAQLAHLSADSKVVYGQMMEAVKVGLTQGLHNVFLLSTILMVIGFVLTFFIEEVPLRGGRERAVKEQMQEDVAEAVS
jgi:EmrB/QacA subfamily drug resistance transporter